MNLSFLLFFFGGFFIFLNFFIFIFFHLTFFVLFPFSLQNAIETTLEEWKRDIHAHPAAQDISRRVSESLKEVGTFTAPILENIRASLNAALERLFEKKDPQQVESSDVLRELDTFIPTDADLSQPPPAAAAAQSTETAPQPERTAAEMTGEIDSLLARLASDRLPTSPSPPAPEQPEVAPTADTPAVDDMQIQSDLTDDFVYLSNDYKYQKQLEQIMAMGFSDDEAIRAALDATEGNLDVAINSLF